MFYHFALWHGICRRTVVSIPSGPSALAVKEAAWGLARYAAISQVFFQFQHTLGCHLSGILSVSKPISHQNCSPFESNKKCLSFYVFYFSLGFLFSTGKGRGKFSMCHPSVLHIIYLNQMARNLQN